jgi:hypothetical protein
MVVATDDNYNFRATATSFFDDTSIIDLTMASGTFSVEFIFDQTTPPGTKSITVGAFTRSVILNPKLQLVLPLE